jgi:hypothetical protein
VLSANVQSFAFLGDNFILASTSSPLALLVYSLEQRPDDDITQGSMHLLRFLFGPRFQKPHGTSQIPIKSDPSPGCLPSTGQVPFQVAGDERMIALYSEYFDFGKGRTFLIPVKSFLGQIKSLLVNSEGLDVDWELHGPEFIEHLPGHDRWTIRSFFVFGMRYIMPTVAHFDKPMMIIRDLSQRRCLRARKEVRDKSDLIYKATTWTPHHETTPHPRGILSLVPFPESIDLYLNPVLLISEDNIVVLEDVRH